MYAHFANVYGITSFTSKFIDNTRTERSRHRFFNYNQVVGLEGGNDDVVVIFLQYLFIHVQTLLWVKLEIGGYCNLN